MKAIGSKKCGSKTIQTDLSGIFRRKKASHQKLKTGIFKNINVILFLPTVNNLTWPD
jgi:hypothetical protein